jgi:hypothetical protein
MCEGVGGWRKFNRKAKNRKKHGLLCCPPHTSLRFSPLSFHDKHPEIKIRKIRKFEVLLGMIPRKLSFLAIVTHGATKGEYFIF